MIKIQQLYKSFDRFPVLTDLNLTVQKGSIYGLIGTNGAGKTTLIKHLAGILEPDSGSIAIEGQPVFEHPSTKARIGYVADDLSFFISYSLKEFARLYGGLYPRFDQKRYAKLVELFQLDEKRQLSRFSKGMQKQAAFALVMSTRPDYLILDEPIDGLDPLVRKSVWSCVIEDVAERNMTVLVSSHNLRELEGICDFIGILSHGRMKLERDLDELRADLHKVQAAFASDRAPAGENAQDRYAGLNVLHRERRGSVDLLIVREKRQKVEDVIRAQNPLFFDLLPLSLEEIFIYELGGENHELEGILF